MCKCYLNTDVKQNLQPVRRTCPVVPLVFAGELMRCKLCIELTSDGSEMVATNEVPNERVPAAED